MNEDRKALADLFARLFAMGVQTADMHGCGNVHCARCEAVDAGQYDVLQVLGEMMNHPTHGITMGDVLTAAKRAGVY